MFCVYCVQVEEKQEENKISSKPDKKQKREDSDLKDLIDQTDLANYFVNPTPEIFTDEHAPDYSFLSRFDVYPDDFLEIKSNADYFYDDPFDSKGLKIKESELLIDELDLPCDILPYLEDDSFTSQDFSRDDDLPSPDNEDKDFDPPFYEPLVFKDVPNSMRLLLFSSKNEEKVFKPGIYTSEKTMLYAVMVVLGLNIDITLCAIPLSIFVFSQGFQDKGLDVYVDLIGSSPLTQTWMVDFMPDRAMIDASQHKCIRCETEYAYIGYGFLPFSFSSFEELEKDGAVLLKQN
uniref:Uncharacterized protein n=1 Tax=Tanacetum cinerariifolium TaxID=118510 RepID=A0A6L2JDV0_TANCI|nr:hypothetical protein [Tanacetum cinerariifolium]